MNTKGTFDRNNYDRCENNFRALTRKLRRDFEINISEGLKEKPKTFWSYVRSRLKIREQIASLMKPDGSTAKTVADKAETLNNFFASTFTVEDLKNIPSTPPSTVDEVLYSIVITPDIVKEKLEALNPNKSPGHFS